MADGSNEELRDRLAQLDDAVALLQKMWRPDDEHYRADVFRQIMGSLSYAYFAYFHADPEHPDWAPLWNPVYTLQPNPDDIYLYAPIRGDLTYRVTGNRGTCAILSFTTSDASSGLVDPAYVSSHHNDIDDRELGLRLGEEFEVLFSGERPAGHTGLWAPVDPGAVLMMVRYRSVDWASEVDPVLSIECVDDVPLKPRLDPGEILDRLRLMSGFPARRSDRFMRMQNGLKERAGINVFEPTRYISGLSKQVYWPAVFELSEGEALVIETEMPETCEYWNIQLNDPYFNAVEYVYRMSSLNPASAQLSSDGRLRAVVALEDPGVPNWLDPAGFVEGTIYGRWYGASSSPLPTINRVRLADLHRHLPADTPHIDAATRAEQLRSRVRAAQRRRRW